MKSPDISLEPRRFTREEIEASFEPCVYCGRIEERNEAGVYKITHDYSLHPGFTVRRYERLSTEELMLLPQVEWERV